MPIPQVYIDGARDVQHRAAHDNLPQIRLVAGPGAGKSSAIEERVFWLLAQRVPPAEIFAISFTRASTQDLRERIRRYCTDRGQPLASQVQVSTLHSLALRILRRAGLLERYPADPLVLDDWELENIFDAEYGQLPNAGGKRRREQVRLYHEAFWSTGVYRPANYIPPNPPISDGESRRFLAFHGPTTQTYSCVLPGEIVRQCVEEIEAGNLDPVQLLGISHLIVDEFQDLNPIDLDFVYAAADRGVRVLIAGDDDQSVYSFRYAQPAGIQDFPARYPATGLHTLDDCFRCIPNILAAASALIGTFPSPNRIPKHLASLYRHCAPDAQGIVHRWRFGHGATEATALAASCRDLIAGGIDPNEILILLANKRVQLQPIVDALQAANVPFEPPRTGGFSDTNPGRLVYAILRVVCNHSDYVAHRTILGIRNGVGVGTCHKIREAVIANHLNFLNIFYQPLPNGIFDTRQTTAIDHARAVCGQINGWQITETLGQRTAEITGIVTASLSPNDAILWQDYVANVPPNIQLDELRDLLAAQSDEQALLVLNAVCERLNEPIPPAQILPPRVRLMTMHGAKGLSARIVFIPGLEEQILPGPRRQPYAGLVLEAARLLYVSITRARAACVVSYATRRVMNGAMTAHTPSRFTAHLNGAFANRFNGLTAAEIHAFTSECGHI